MDNHNLFKQKNFNIKKNIEVGRNSYDLSKTNFEHIVDKKEQDNKNLINNGRKEVPLNKINKLPLQEVHDQEENVQEDGVLMKDGERVIRQADIPVDMLQFMSRREKLKKYNDEEKNRRENILREYEIPVPKDADELQEMRAPFFEYVNVVDSQGNYVMSKNGIGISSESVWKVGLSKILTENYDWLADYYKVHNRQLDTNMELNKPLPEIKFREHKVSINTKGMDEAYEDQGSNNCYACTGTAMINQFIALKKGENIKRNVNQFNMRAYQPKVRRIDRNDPDKADTVRYDAEIKTLEDYAGKTKTGTGNIFALGDFVMETLEKNKVHNAMLNKMVLNVPDTDKQKHNNAHDKSMVRNMKAIFADKIAEILRSGSVAGILKTIPNGYGHYVTITGIDGDYVDVYDSYPYTGASKKLPIDHFVRKGYYVEINWISDRKNPDELTREYQNLQYDEINGYSRKKESPNSQTDDILHTKGITVEKDDLELGEAYEGVTQYSYITDNKKKIETESFANALKTANQAIIERRNQNKAPKNTGNKRTKKEEKNELKPEIKISKKEVKKNDKKADNKVIRKEEKKEEKKAEKKTEKKAVDKSAEEAKLEAKLKDVNAVRQEITGEIDKKNAAEYRDAVKLQKAYEKSNKDYDTFGLGVDLRNTQIAAADSQRMREIKESLDRYLKLRDSIFAKYGYAEMEAEDIGLLNSGLSKSAEARMRTRKNNKGKAVDYIVNEKAAEERWEENNISEDETEQLGEAFEELRGLVKDYILVNDRLFKTGRGKARVRQVRYLGEKLQMDNIRFGLSQERRNLKKTIDMKYQKSYSSARQWLVPTWGKYLVMSDLIDAGNQKYRDERRRQKKEGTTPAWYKRLGEWMLRGLKNNGLRLGMAYEGIGGLVDRTIGLATAGVANVVNLTGKVIKLPLKGLSMLFNTVSKNVFMSKKRWRMDYDPRKGWKGIDDGRKIFRKYLKGACVLPAAVIETLYRGVPTLFGHRFKSGVYKRTGKWSKVIFDDVKSVAQSLVSKDYEKIEDRGDLDTLMAGGPGAEMERLQNKEAEDNITDADSSFDEEFVVIDEEEKLEDKKEENKGENKKDNKEERKEENKEENKEERKEENKEEHKEENKEENKEKNEEEKEEEKEENKEEKKEEKVVLKNLLEMSDDEFKEEIKEAQESVKEDLKAATDATEGKIQERYINPWSSQDNSKMAQESRQHAKLLEEQSKQRKKSGFMTDSQYKNSFKNKDEYRIRSVKGYQMSLSRRIRLSKNKDAIKLYMTNDLKLIDRSAKIIKEISGEIKGFGEYMAERKALLLKLEKYKQDAAKKKAVEIVDGEGKVLTKKDIEDMGKDLYNPDRYFEVKGTSFGEKQNTTTGCWSHSLSVQLRTRGIDMNQHEVRLYRPDAPDNGEEKLLKNNGFGDDKQANPMDYSEIMVKYRANTAVHAAEIDLDMAMFNEREKIQDKMTKLMPKVDHNAPAEDLQMIENEREAVLNKLLNKHYSRLPQYKAAREQYIEYTRRSIVDAIAKHRSPVTVNFYGHYITVFGIQGTLIKYYEPMSPHKSGVMYSDLRNLYSRKAELMWFEDFEKNELKKQSSGVSYDEKGELKGGQFSSSSNIHISGVNADVSKQEKLDGMAEMESKVRKGEKLYVKLEGVNDGITDRVYYPKKAS
ncbi:MAG: hypothetical protein J6X66_01630 [Lachnospiraceae bacterium]|nr:hypothetical protein [Lachnospiraceae bacterium]